MSSREKEQWVAQLWFLSLLMVGGFGAVVGSGGNASAWIPLIVGGGSFTVAFIIWLFRVTYLAGQRS